MKACFFATLAVPFLAFASGGPFKIMSYNIRHGVTSDKGFDLSRAACVMAAEKPRFVALQEIDMYTDRVGRTNSCEVLARFKAKSIRAPRTGISPRRSIMAEESTGLRFYRRKNRCGSIK